LKVCEGAGQQFFELHDDQAGSPHTQTAFHVDNNAKDSVMNVLIIGATGNAGAIFMGAALTTIRLIPVQRNDVSNCDTA
jgi:hypothetical protein